MSNDTSRPGGIKKLLLLSVLAVLLLLACFIGHRPRPLIKVLERKELFNHGLEQTTFIVGRAKKQGICIRFVNPVQNWSCRAQIAGGCIAGTLETVESLCHRMNADVGINLSYFGHAFNQVATGDLQGQLVSDGRLVKSMNTKYPRAGAMGIDAGNRLYFTNNLIPDIRLRFPDGDILQDVSINSLQWKNGTSVVLWGQAVGSWPPAPDGSILLWCLCPESAGSFSIGREINLIIESYGKPRRFNEREVAILFPDGLSSQKLPQNSQITLTISYPEPWNTCKEIGECGPFVYRNGSIVLPGGWNSTENVIGFGDNNEGDWIIIAVKDCNRRDLLAAMAQFGCRNFGLLDCGTSATVVVDGYQRFGISKCVGSGLLFFGKNK